MNKKPGVFTTLMFGFLALGSVTCLFRALEEAQVANPGVQNDLEFFLENIEHADKQNVAAARLLEEAQSASSELDALFQQQAQISKEIQAIQADLDAANAAATKARRLEENIQTNVKDNNDQKQNIVTKSRRLEEVIEAILRENTDNALTNDKQTTHKPEEDSNPSSVLQTTDELNALIDQLKMREAANALEEKGPVSLLAKTQAQVPATRRRLEEDSNPSAVLQTTDELNALVDQLKMREAANAFEEKGPVSLLAKNQSQVPATRRRLEQIEQLIAAVSKQEKGAAAGVNVNLVDLDNQQQQN